MLIWIYLKGDIMDAFYGDGTEENRKNLDHNFTYYVLS